MSNIYTILEARPPPYNKLLKFYSRQHLIF